MLDSHHTLQERFLATLEQEATPEEVALIRASPDLWPVLLLWWLRGIEEGKRRYSEALNKANFDVGSGPSVSC